MRDDNVGSDERVHEERAVRVAIPVLVSFSSSAQAIRDFILDLSEGGIFLPTEKICEVGTLGTLKFRVSQFEDPFTLKGEVVRIGRPAERSGGDQSGMGIRFVDLTDQDVKRLRRLVDRVRDGSVAESIRRSIRESGRTLDQEIRRRPVDQKLMLAVTATNQEIQALVREGNPTVLVRLLDCPRLNPSHVLTMLRSPLIPTRFLMALRKNGKWLNNDEVRYLFCVHRNSVLSEALVELTRLPHAWQVKIAQDMRVRRPIRVKAAELGRRGGGAARR